MSIVHYLAYGSNLHPLRLAQRVRSAQVLGVVPIRRRRLVFHKRSADGSGKCTLLETSNDANVAYGVLYAFDLPDKRRLDEVEGVGDGYVEQLTKCVLNGVDYHAYLYAAQASHIDPSLRPYHWYKSLVIAGARYHRLADGYVGAIETTASVADPNANRAREKQRLLSQMTAG